VYFLRITPTEMCANRKFPSTNLHRQTNRNVWIALRSLEEGAGGSRAEGGAVLLERGPRNAVQQSELDVGVLKGTFPISSRLDGGA